MRATLACLAMSISACGGRTDHAPLPPQPDGSADTGARGDTVPEVGPDALVEVDTGPFDPDATLPTRPPSCAAGAANAGAGLNCGAAHDDDCCASPPIPGGQFLRFYDGVKHMETGFPAQISTVRIDRYEITVGRFRAFVHAFDSWKPKPGDGAHPKVAGSGWRSTWPLPASAAALSAAVRDPSTCTDGVPTWTDVAGANENRPINCATWYELFAFCAWDRGRLPTLAEQMYAGVGGDEQRLYPWSSPPKSDDVDGEHAVYSPDPFHPAFLAPEDVGSRPKGAGRWSHADLAGNIGELLLDAADTDPPRPCVDCAALPSSKDIRVLIGGGYAGDVTYLQNAFSYLQEANRRSPAIGGRCARDG